MAGHVWYAPSLSAPTPQLEGDVKLLQWQFRNALVLGLLRITSSSGLLIRHANSTGLVLFFLSEKQCVLISGTSIKELAIRQSPLQI